MSARKSEIWTGHVFIFLRYFTKFIEQIIICVLLAQKAFLILETSPGIQGNASRGGKFITTRVVFLVTLIFQAESLKTGNTNAHLFSTSFFPQNVEHGGKLRSKRGLLPFIELNGEEIADSEFIINTLGAKLDKEMDKDLTQEQKGVLHAMNTLMDNHLNW